MRWQGKLAVVAVAVITGMANQPLRAQGIRKYLAPQGQVIAIRAGQIFDARSGSIHNNQVVLITGDRITDVGAAVETAGRAHLWAAFWLCYWKRLMIHSAMAKGCTGRSFSARP
jgi:hypothetical protein